MKTTDYMSMDIFYSNLFLIQTQILFKLKSDYKYKQTERKIIPMR